MRERNAVQFIKSFDKAFKFSHSRIPKKRRDFKHPIPPSAKKLCFVVNQRVLRLTKFPISWVFPQAPQIHQESKFANFAAYKLNQVVSSYLYYISSQDISTASWSQLN
ncbi:hypothetical protein CsatB_029082 [Cannabis sativa]